MHLILKDKTFLLLSFYLLFGSSVLCAVSLHWMTSLPSILILCPPLSSRSCCFCHREAVWNVMHYSQQYVLFLLQYYYNLHFSLSKE